MREGGGPKGRIGSKVRWGLMLKVQDGGWRGRGQAAEVQISEWVSGRRQREESVIYVEVGEFWV